MGVLILSLVQAVHALTVAIRVELPAPLRLEPLEPIAALDPISPAAPVVAVLGLGLAVGLWRLHYWAWYLTFLWVGVSMAGALVSYVQGERPYEVMAIGVIAVLYLNQRSVQTAFRPFLEEEGVP